MRRVSKKFLKAFYEQEAKQFAHQEMMYLKGSKHGLWWHRKRLYYIMSFLSNIFENNHVSTFADFGCAEGFYVKRVSSLHYEIFCIGGDLASTYIKKARAQSRSSNAEYVLLDIERLPFRDNSIDVVLCSEVLEHTSDYRKSLTELHRVTKSYLVLSFPGHSFIYGVVGRIKTIKRLAESLLPNVGHISEVTISDVKEALRGQFKSSKVKLGGALPLLLVKIIPSIRLVEAIDNFLCKTIGYFGGIDYVTIKVMKIAKK